MSKSNTKNAQVTTAANTKAKEATPCQGNIDYVINVQEQQVTCKFADLTQGAICASCPWSKLCAHLFQKTNTVTVLAFSGMLIGELPITKETKTTLEVQAHNGTTLIFDKNTKIQTNPKNPKYANKLA